MRAEGYWDLDFSIFKSFPMREDTIFRLRLESFNLLVNVVHGIPSSSFSNPILFVHVTSTANIAREIQFDARIIF